MSERPRKAASPGVPPQDPPVEPLVEELTEETAENLGSRPSSDGRKRRAKKQPSSSTPKNAHVDESGSSSEIIKQPGNSQNQEDSQVPAQLDTSEPHLSAKPENMDQYLEMTHSEKIRKLSEKLAGFKAPEDLKKISMRGALYDHRATQIVERVGLGNERTNMLAAQSAYLEAKTLAHKQGFAPENIGDLKKAYNDSLFAWNTSLLTAAEKLDGKERLETLAIRKRDTILRPQTIEIEARRAGIDAKVWYSLDKWMNEETPGNLARIVNAPTSVAGKGWAMLWHKSARGKSVDAQMARAELGRKYARAGRILGGAAAATAIAVAASPVTATTVGLTFAVFAGRGLIGTVAGMAGGYAGGGAYQRFFGSKKKESLNFSENARKQFDNAEEFESFQSLYGANSTRARGKEKAVWQMGGALLAGGSTGLVTSPVAHFALDQMGALPSVQNAAETIAIRDSGQAVAETPRLSEAAPTVPDGTPVAAEATSVLEAAYITPVAPEGVALHEASIGKGEGFNQLIVDLRASGFTGFDSELSATELSEKMGAIDSDGKSAMMLEGDKLLVDAKGNVWFERNGETQLLMENKNGEYIPHKLEGIEMRATGPTGTPVPEVAVQNQAVSSETLETPAPTQSEAPGVTADPVAEAIPTEILEPVEERQDELVNEGFLPRANLGNGPGVEEMPTNSLRTSPLSEFVPDTQEESLLETGSSPEVFTNGYGVEINDTVPSTYEWKVPGMDRTLTVSSGGSPEERSVFARAYANEHPGTTVHFITPVLNNGVVQLRLDAWDSAEGGPAQRLEDIAIRESTGAPAQSFSRIDPRDFIKKLP